MSRFTRVDHSRPADPRRRPAPRARIGTDSETRSRRRSPPLVHAARFARKTIRAEAMSIAGWPIGIVVQ